MEEYRKNITMLEGPFVNHAFSNSEESTNVMSRKIITTYIQDGYLCEQTVNRDYRDGDYHDTVKTKRIIKLDN